MKLFGGSFELRNCLLFTSCLCRGFCRRTESDRFPFLFSFHVCTDILCKTIHKSSWTIKREKLFCHCKVLSRTLTVVLSNLLRYHIMSVSRSLCLVFSEQSGSFGIAISQISFLLSYPPLIIIRTNKTIHACHYTQWT